jgi:hypothetical protein
MTYTLWSHDVLLGESELDMPLPEGGMLAGGLRLTAAGRDAMHVFAEAMDAVMALQPMLEREGLSAERLGPALGEAMFDALHATPEGQRFAETRRAIADLALELRDAAGARVATEDLWIQDVARFGDAGDVATLDALPPEVQAEAETAGLMRYLLFASLGSGASS